MLISAVIVSSDTLNTEPDAPIQKNNVPKSEIHIQSDNKNHEHNSDSRTETVISDTKNVVTKSDDVKPPEINLNNDEQRLDPSSIEQIPQNQPAEIELGTIVEETNNDSV